jgi:hypothetical protein
MFFVFTRASARGGGDRKTATGREEEKYREI